MLLLALPILCLTLPGVWPHGMLWTPPSRSSAYRKGFDTPPNYNDNELNCGGFQNQWGNNGGKCGECGDPWEIPVGERENQAGGTYATGTIVATYQEGQVIDIEVDVTANHKGWFEFRMCVNNDYTKAITQECLDQHLLEMADGSGTRWMLTSADNKVYNMAVRLPAGVTCSQCVIQWKWHCGNSWGTAENGTECVGCGPQEQFYGCADVAITGDGVTTTEEPPTTTTGTATTTTGGGSTTTVPSTTTTTQASTTQTTTTVPTTTTTTTPGDCAWIDAGCPDPELDDWCNMNCGAPEPYCPPEQCCCDDTCDKTCVP